MKHKALNGIGMIRSGEAGGYEETLRLMANLPAPEGLVDRVQEGLRSAPLGSRVLAWPPAASPVNGWLRVAAAAAIVSVVAGGGWGVITHVRPATATRGEDVAPHAAVQSGFSTAGAMRTPQTLQGPVAPIVESGDRKTKTQPEKMARRAKPPAGIAIRPAPGESK